MRLFSRFTTVAGEPPSRAQARTASCNWPMMAAAGTPRPTTSPITTPRRPAPNGKTSYQSPPTSRPAPPGRYLAPRTRPGSSGRALGSRLCWRVTAIRRICS